MVWNPIKANNMRRRQKSQSPSSSSDSSTRGSKSLFGTKHKRTMFRKDSAALTEASSMSSRSTAAAESAPWRVENIRPAPPRPEEWWEGAGSSDTDSYEADEHGNVSPKVVFSPRVPGRRTKFHNCGLETWLRAREEWQQRTVETLPARSTPAEHVQLVKGLTKASTQRTYELPRPMALSDLISVYQDIWSGEGI
ncbi:hypothetical protein IV203_037638 [Nitzschia inconspicua]|uniref:DUF4050 domain-containing protein n=1 Tax=Nitzschia inconspicua TaxID=303405 RepID=A0A9K3PYR3_9STRA|nr:hypothetical protein IV203_037638 [Nitzschia inconspicua]